MGGEYYNKCYDLSCCGYEQDSFSLAMAQWSALVNMVMNIQFP
jgi:hypothetical protein